jgi:hypothetical protein
VILPQFESVPKAEIYLTLSRFESVSKAKISSLKSEEDQIMCRKIKEAQTPLTEADDTEGNH